MVENLRKPEPRILSICCPTARAVAMSVRTAFIFALDALPTKKPPGVQRHARDNFRDMSLRSVAQSP
jgi:hypothetical protein